MYKEQHKNDVLLNSILIFTILAASLWSIFSTSFQQEALGQNPDVCPSPCATANNATTTSEAGNATSNATNGSTTSNPVATNGY
jgi:hypothetical protein